jgi:hypothetical protein
LIVASYFKFYRQSVIPTPASKLQLHPQIHNE